MSSQQEDQAPPLCVRCHQPVRINQSHYDVFERMHWLCFHLEYEHMGPGFMNADPDEGCDDPSCPWWQIEVFRHKLDELGYDTHEMLWEAARMRRPPHNETTGP